MSIKAILLRTMTLQPIKRMAAANVQHPLQKSIRLQTNDYLPPSYSNMDTTELYFVFRSYPTAFKG
jgi:hypothetical protein